MNEIYRRAMRQFINPFVADLVCELVGEVGGIATLGELAVRHVSSPDGQPPKGNADPVAIERTDPGALAEILRCVRGEGLPPAAGTVIEAVRQRFGVAGGLPWFHRSGACFAFTAAVAVPAAESGR